MNKPNKEIKWQKDGTLQVDVTVSDVLFTVVDGKKIEIGDYAQTTIQRVKDIKHFKVGILEEESKIIEQQEQNEQTLESLKDVDEGLFNDKQLKVLDTDIPNALKAMFGKDAPQDVKRCAKDIRMALMKLPSLDVAVKEIKKKKIALGARKYFKDQLKGIEEDKKIIFK